MPIFSLLAVSEVVVLATAGATSHTSVGTTTFFGVAAKLCFHLIGSPVNTMDDSLLHSSIPGGDVY